MPGKTTRKREPKIRALHHPLEELTPEEAEQIQGGLTVGLGDGSVRFATGAIVAPLLIKDGTSNTLEVV